MDRVLKFKIWDEKYHCWDSKYFNLYPAPSELLIQGRVLLQFIGRLDINGKEIYDGDIVRYTIKDNEHGDAQTLVAKIMWCNEFSAWGLGKEEVWNIFSDYGILKVEVIGNIFENRDLLENKKE
jgi:uncharacterized phage protein (TIGR01671 family)